MLTPQCVAVDAQDNIYVTDSDAGMIFVFEPSGKYLRTIGSLKGGEGYFKRPTGIAVDSAAQRIYVTDTLRDEVFVLDMQGNILQTIGKTGDGEGEFNLPTELRLDGPNLMVVDAMNFRVQVFDRSGNFPVRHRKNRRQSPEPCSGPKAVSVDSEGDLYVVDALWGVVQVFNRQGQLLYYFGAKGTHAGEFQLPSGLFIDHDDRVFVVDSFNRRIQVFHYAGLKKPAHGGQAVRLRMLLAGLMILLTGTSLYAQISGDVMGMHNLGPGSNSPITGARPDACAYCHAPHSGLNTGLWNQKLTTQIYTTYTSNTEKNSGTQPSSAASAINASVAMTAPSRLGPPWPMGRSPRAGRCTRPMCSAATCSRRIRSAWRCP